MNDKNLPIDNKVHELKLGRSFDSSSRTAFHSIRYDFKPASVDTAREASFEVGEGHQVSVTLPHVQSSGTSHTVYKGNKKPCPKECVLIIDHDTGTFTLEKLTNTVQLKKTRIAQQRPLTPVEVTKRSPSRPKANEKSPSSLKGSSPVMSSQQEEAAAAPEPMDTCLGEISSSSSSSSSEDSDSDSKPPAKPAGQAPRPPPVTGSSKPGQFSLLNDLELSESGSDSD